MTVRRSRVEWLELLAEFEASGETAARFCAKRRISAGTFSWWRWNLRHKHHEVAARESVRLVAVDVKGGAAPPAFLGGVRIALADLELRIEVGTDVAYVSSLVDALRARC